MNNFSNNSLKFFSLLSFVVLLYTIYRAEFHYAGFDRSFVYAIYLKYIFISIFFVIFFLIITKMKEHFKANFVIFLYATIILLYLAEVLLLINYNYLPKKILVQSNELEILKNKIKKYEDFLSRNIFPFTSFDNVITLNDNKSFFPLAGISNRKTYYCDKNGNDIYYTSDKYGFRNQNNIWNEDTIDYLLIGDSFIHGACVDDAYIISSYIKNILNTKVLNLGMGGAGPLKEYAIFQEYGKEKKPKKVFWFFYEGNDLTKDLRHEKTNPTLMNYLEDEFTQNLTNHQINIDKLLIQSIKDEIESEKNKIEIYTQSPEKKQIYFNKIEIFLQNTKYLRLWAVRGLVKKVFSRQDVDPLFKIILKKTKETINNWGGEFYFVYLPEKKRYSNEFNFYIVKNSFRNKKKIINSVKNLNIDVIDIDEELFRNFKLEKIKSLIPAHYNEEGYKLISNYLINTN